MPQQSRLSSFIAELRRRRVFRVAAFYGGIAFVIVQIIDGTFDLMGVPQWVGRVMVTLLAVGFPVAMILAWVFDITLEGIVRTEGVLREPQGDESGGTSQPGTGKPLTSNRALIAVTLLAIAFGIWGRWGGVGDDRISSVAVLPFDNLGTPEQEFFADGLTDDLITELSQIGDLRVISRTSSMRYKGSNKSLKEIADELDVGAILEGTVRRSGGQIRIVAQLIDIKTDDHLWSNTYDIAEEMTAIFSMQTQLVKNIVRSLQSHLVDEVDDVAAPTANLAAFDDVLQGHAQRWHNFGEEGLLAAVEHYTAATRKDPNYTQAWAYLAIAHLTLYWRGYVWGQSTSDRLAQAEAALRRAVLLDENDPITIYANGLYAYYGLEDWPAAQRIFEKALLFRPHDPDILTINGAIRRRQGDFLGMIQYFQKAIESDPYLRSAYWNLAISLLALRDYDAMDRYFKTAISLWPEQGFMYYWQYRAIAAGRGDLEAGAKFLEDMRRSVGQESLDFWGNLSATHTLLSGDTTGLGDALTHASIQSLPALFAAYWSGNEALYRAQADSISAWFADYREINIAYQPHFSLIDATLLAMEGNSAAALEAGRKVIEAWPIERDALASARVLYYWCLTQVVAGDLEGALASAKILLEIPSYLTRFELLSSVAFGPLRQHPGFADLVKGPSR